MAIEAPLPPQPVVRPVSDAERGHPDAREKRDGKKKRPQQRQREESAPAPNELGQITGKVIDILA